MNELALGGSWVGWALALALAFPLLVVLLGEVSHALEVRGSPLLSALQALRNLVLPSLVALLLLSRVLGYGSADTAWRVVATVFWICAIHASLSLLNAILFAKARAGSWRARVPPLLRDMSRFFLILVGAAFVLSSVWGIDLSGLLAALGVGSLVVGLALQDTLGNVFSGIALLFEHPLRVGDWVEVGDKTGRVVGMNSRAVNLENADRELVVVPNRLLGQAHFRNLSHAGAYGHRLGFGFSYDDPPNRVKQLLTQVARETRGVLADPVPVARLNSYDEHQIRYEIRLFIGDYGDLGRVCDEFATRLWYAARRQDLTMRPELEPVAPEQRREEQVLERLQTIPALATVEQRVLQALAKGVEIQHFGKGERLIRQGDPGKALYIIIDGQAVVAATDDEGVEQEVGRLHRGEYFGEMALLSSEVSTASVTAAEDMEVVAIRPDPVRKMVDSAPRLARELNVTMARRREETIRESRNAP